MYARRIVVIAVLALSAFVPLLAAEEPQPGKVRLVHWLKNADENLAAGGFLADGRLLLEGDNYLRIWNPKSGKEDARFNFTFGKPFTFTVVPSPDGKTVAALFPVERDIRLFDVASGKQLLLLHRPNEPRWLKFAPDGRTLIAISDGLRLWDVKTGKELWRLRLELPEKSPLDLRKTWETEHISAFSPDGKILAVALQDGSIHLCDTKTGCEVRRLFRKVARANPSKLAFSPDGRYLAASAEEKGEEINFKGEERRPTVIRLWDMRSGQLVRTFKQYRLRLSIKDRINSRLLMEQELMKDLGEEIVGMAFSADGKTVVNSGSVTKLWEVATGRIRHEFDGNTSSRVCFSPDGRLVAAKCCSLNRDDDGQWTAKWDGIRMWDWRDSCLEQPKEFGARDIQRSWSDLASADAAVGYRAIAVFIAHPQRAVSALGEHLQRVEPIGSGEMDRLIANLDDESFSIREKAVARLAALGELTRPVLQRVKEQRPSLEVRRRVEDLLERLTQPGGGPEKLRCVRAVEVLESIGTEEARRAIRRLSSGVAGAVETEDAKAALSRLNRRQEGRNK